jgi:hypothetical protein
MQPLPSANQQLSDLLQAMWKDYVDLNPAAGRIYQLLSQQGEVVLNDHIALRTFNHPRLGLESMATTFKKLGYTEKKDYFFKEKKLYAKHYEHSEESFPKIFISELETEKLSPFVQKTVNWIVDQLSDETIRSPLFTMCGRPWRMDYQTYLEIAKESEYASWVAAHGFRPNHFTVNVNALNQLNDLVRLNQFLEKHGFALNKSGGAIKGTPEQFLEQSSTMAEPIPVSFSDGSFSIPGCYYEFAKRYTLPDGKLYTGFVAASADKIFESTNRR